jgi:hypothetical protein
VHSLLLYQKQQDEEAREGIGKVREEEEKANSAKSLE